MFKPTPDGIILLLIASQIQYKKLQSEFWANKTKQENHTTLKEQKEALIRESYPVAEQDNLIVRTFPKEEQQGIVVLNSNKINFGNAKLRDINKKTRGN